MDEKFISETIKSLTVTFNSAAMTRGESKIQKKTRWWLYKIETKEKK
jgi:hypothetical protein